MTDINIDECSSIGLIFRRTINPKDLRNLLSAIQDELGFRFDQHEVCVATIDTETAQKYGLHEDLNRSKAVSKLSDRMVNFYYEYSQDRESMYSEMIDYLRKVPGSILIFLDEPDEDTLKILESNSKFTNLNKIQFKL